MDMNITDKFIDKLLSLEPECMPREIYAQAKKCLLDYLGVTLAGAQMLKEKEDKLIEFLTMEAGESTIIGFERKSAIQNAILVNGISSHYAELDDGHRVGMIHLGSPIISALLPVVEQKKVSGLDFLFAIIVGYEVAVRLSVAMQPSHKYKGYHATSTCGTIGAAMAISAALGYSRKQAKSTLSASVTSAAGVLEIQEDKSELKPYNSGRAALNGYISALVGAAGVDGPDDILGGPRGLFSVMSDEHDASHLFNPRSDSFSIEGVYMKKYASCRHSHSAIEAAIRIVREHGLIIEDLELINVYTYRSAVFGHDHKKIRGIGSAKMSTPYSVAVAIATGKAGIHEYSKQKITDEEILSLANKINIYEDSELTKEEPQTRAAVVEVILSNKVSYREKVGSPKGEPENPMTQKEIEEKFEDLALYSGKTKEEAEIIINIIESIEKNPKKIFEAL